jgi:secondary thiamine-phosphate synthase enzyme
MGVYHDEITISTHYEGEIIDLTDDVQQIVHKSRIREGLVCIFIPGSTGAVTTMEYEPGLLKDFPRALERLAPTKMSYDHHETWHDDNGRSHVRANILGPSLTVP